MTRFTISSILAAAAIAFTALAGLSSTLFAQTYPSRPVRFIVPFATGGPADFGARTVGEALSKRLGQAVVIENRPGAEGAIAGQAVQSASPDGHTLLYSGFAALGLSVLKNPPPFAAADFAPVSQITQFEWGMYVSHHVSADSIAAFIAYARTNPDKLNYVSNNVNEHSAAVQFMKATGTRMVRVPYKGLSSALPDLFAGRVQVAFFPLTVTLPYARDGRLRMLAVLAPQRSRFAPDVPTLAEAGVLGVSVPSWQAVFAPAKTAREIIERLNGEINRTLHDPEVRAQFERQGVQVKGSTVGELAATIKEDIATLSQFINQYGIAAD